MPQVMLQLLGVTECVNVQIPDFNTLPNVIVYGKHACVLVSKQSRCYNEVFSYMVPERFVQSFKGNMSHETGTSNRT